MYLGEMGVQWGVLSDGNKYVMYNSRGGSSFEEQKFLTMTVKDVDTEDGLPCEEFAEKMIALMSKECLENDDIQATYEQHIIDRQIESAIHSLLSSPFDTLASAIKSEFREERVKTNENLKISKKRIIDYLEALTDEEGQLPINLSGEDSEQRDSELMKEVAINPSGNVVAEMHVRSPRNTKLVSVADLLNEKLVHEGDNWRLHYKGETFWARVTGNGDLEVNGQLFANPSRAGTFLIQRPCSGWNRWFYKDGTGEWHEIENLRAKYRDRHGLAAVKRTRATDAA